MTKPQEISPGYWAAGEGPFLASRVLSDEAEGKIGLANAVRPSNWQKYRNYMDGLTLGGSSVPDSEATTISRDQVFDLAHLARESGCEQDLHNLFWNVMAWGTVGDMRNISAIAKIRYCFDTSFHGHFAAIGKVQLSRRPNWWLHHVRQEREDSSTRHRILQ